MHKDIIFKLHISIKHFQTTHSGTSELIIRQIVKIEMALPVRLHVTNGMT